VAHVHGLDYTVLGKVDVCLAKQAAQLVRQLTPGLLRSLLG